jgi:hypothetical protein
MMDDALMMEAIRSSETSVLTKNTRRKFPEDGFLHSHRRENLKSYMTYVCFHIGSALYRNVIYVMSLSNSLYYEIISRNM